MKWGEEEIEASFNPINLDYIFRMMIHCHHRLKKEKIHYQKEYNMLSSLCITDTNDENMKAGNDVDSNENNGGLSAPSNSSGNGGNNVEVEKIDDEDDGDEQRQNDPYQEISYNKHDKSLVIDMIVDRPDIIPFDSSLGDSRRCG